MKIYLVINGWYGRCPEQAHTLLQQFRELAGEGEPDGVICLGEQVPEQPLPFSEVTLWQSDRSAGEAVLDRLAEELPRDSCILFGWDSGSMELAARLAIRRRGTSLMRAEKLAWDESGLTAWKKICSGNMMGRYRLTAGPFCISLQEKHGAGTPADGVCRWRTEPVAPGNVRIRQIRQECEPAGKDLAGAERVLVIGNGIKKKEDVERLQALAERIHAQTGASRPVAMQGLLPLRNLIGVSGTVIHPRICLVIGVSGMAAFYDGIEDSTCILAVNRDPEAPIMKKADYIFCGDWKSLV